MAAPSCLKYDGPPCAALQSAYWGLEDKDREIERLRAAISAAIKDERRPDGMGTVWFVGGMAEQLADALKPSSDSERSGEAPK